MKGIWMLALAVIGLMAAFGTPVHAADAQTVDLTSGWMWTAAMSPLPNVAVPALAVPAVALPAVHVAAPVTVTSAPALTTTTKQCFKDASGNCQTNIKPAYTDPKDPCQTDPQGAACQAQKKADKIIWENALRAGEMILKKMSDWALGKLIGECARALLSCPP